MTRRTRRIKRRLNDLQQPDTAVSRGVTFRHFAVDADGEAVGQTAELRVTFDDDGTQFTERDTFALPNGRRGDSP